MPGRHEYGAVDETNEKDTGAMFSKKHKLTTPCRCITIPSVRTNARMRRQNGKKQHEEVVRLSERCPNTSTRNHALCTHSKLRLPWGQRGGRFSLKNFRVICLRALVFTTAYQVQRNKSYLWRTGVGSSAGIESGTLDLRNTVHRPSKHHTWTQGF